MSDTTLSSAEDQQDNDPLFFKLLFLVPIIGWLFKDAVHGNSEAKYYFCANFFVGWGLAIAFFGYAAIIIPALCLVALAFTWIIGVCR
ncbi:hypothetical protein PsW64_00467 [Pseudovibrio sp. W64]|uniref:hypothetical protein n=1 Tax=unclassified Pseudovibrio TaxID=2627060 RepID=UPI0007AE9CC4|nr:MULTISPECIES: hypothetical protein [unclassified Pseudovibrio]KZK77056.1 hypothetical protein PsAD46_04882 [Pseudovibrio sp. Ad46]KZK80480.1 hypothetical protein PsAD13_04542 [Pseudovibrio sp. Ad13]KZK89551.1 hypothetical protein PsAD5_04835 [Pseudovibrio sp. Ad5]KZK89841.1 hypothetical protein PsW64_00467 [Pseudovibrio sp. W64]